MSETSNFKRTLIGTVVSAKCDKTITVNVVRRFKDRKYSKFVEMSKKFHAHDENNTAKAGDRVKIIESRPMSKSKRWALEKVYEA